MRILDSQGRLFGRVNILDLGAGLVILLVVIGIFFLPGTGGSVAQIGTTQKAIEVDALVRSLPTTNPQSLLKAGDRTNIIIRNQPHGSALIKAVRVLPRNVVVPQPDGSVKSLPDPRPADSTLATDILITIAGNAQITKNGPVLGNDKIKVGTILELEGLTYDFNTSVTDVRIKG